MNWKHTAGGTQKLFNLGNWDKKYCRHTVLCLRKTFHCILTVSHPQQRWTNLPSNPHRQHRQLAYSGTFPDSHSVVIELLRCQILECKQPSINNRQREFTTIFNGCFTAYCNTKFICIYNISVGLNKGRIGTTSALQAMAGPLLPITG